MRARPTRTSRRRSKKTHNYRLLYFIKAAFGWPFFCSRAKNTTFAAQRPRPKVKTMTKIRITKQFSFETGHALFGYDGKCKNVHGHSYKLSVTVIGTPITDRDNVKFGMVIDFSDLKTIVKEEIVDLFDHATVFNQTTPHVELAKELKQRGHHVILVDYQPTSENMVVDFAKKIINRLPNSIALHSLRLQETETSYAEWYASDNL